MPQTLSQKIISEHVVVAEGDAKTARWVGDVVCDGRNEMVALTPRRDVQLSPRLNARERTILLAGGPIAFAKA